MPMRSDIDKLKKMLQDIAVLSSPFLDEVCGKAACEQALEAAEGGSYGVGAVIVDPNGSIRAYGRNEMFTPPFRSDRHAEMMAMNRLEDSNPEVTDLSRFV